MHSTNGRDPKKPDEVLEGIGRMLSFEVINTGCYRSVQGNECHRKGKLGSPCLLFLLIKPKCVCLNRKGISVEPIT